jgi:hypothetical protein
VALPFHVRFLAWPAVYFSRSPPFASVVGGLNRPARAGLTGHAHND